MEKCDMHLSSRTVYTVSTVHNYLKQILTALGFIHSLSVIHFDVKPCNILPKKDVIKLADFGSARYCKLGKKINLGKDKHGSTNYMAQKC